MKTIEILSVVGLVAGLVGVSVGGLITASELSGDLKEEVKNVYVMDGTNEYEDMIVGLEEELNVLINEGELENISEEDIANLSFEEVFETVMDNVEGEYIDELKNELNSVDKDKVNERIEEVLVEEFGKEFVLIVKGEKEGLSAEEIGNVVKNHLDFKINETYSYKEGEELKGSEKMFQSMVNGIKR